MANDFNPSPGPPNDPNYTGYSRATPQPEANRGAGLALDTVAQGTTLGLHAFDESMKSGIRNNLYEKIDTQRDQFTSALETLNNQLKAGPPATAQADTGKIAPAGSYATDGKGGFGPTDPKQQSLFDARGEAPEDNLPVGLQDGIDKFANLQLAKQSGAIKLNDTDYAGKVLSIAKQLRSQYPGYREYIDEQTSKISGLPVANSYYQNLLLDVNRQLAQQKAGPDVMEKQMEWALHEGVPHINTYMQWRSTGDPKYQKMGGDGKVLELINNWTTNRANMAADEKKRSAADWDEKTRIAQDTKSITRNATNFVANQVDNNIALSGMPTFKDISGYLDDVAGNRIPKLNEVELEVRKNQLETYYNYALNTMRKDNKDLIQSIGSENAERIFKSALTPIDQYRQLANQKDGPLAQLSQVMSKHIANQDEYSWLTDKDQGPLSRAFVTGRKIYGDQYGPIWLKGMLGLGMDESVKNRLIQEGVAATVPLTDANGNPTRPPRYLKDTISDAKKAGKDGEGIPDPAFYGHAIGLVTGITDPAMPMAMKDKLIQYGFDPKNAGIMNEFRQDFRNPTTGEYIPGKEAAFVRMTSPAMSQNIAESAKAKPENYTNYLNWTRTEWANAYREDLQQLDQWKFSSSAPGALPADKLFTQNPYHMAYDNTHKQLILMDKNDRPVDRPIEERKLGMKPFFDKLDTVNRGLSGLNSSYMYSPQKPGNLDVDGYILQTIRPFLTKDNQTAFTAQMSRAIIKANKPEMKMKDIDNLLFGNQGP